MNEGFDIQAVVPNADRSRPRRAGDHAHPALKTATTRQRCRSTSQRARRRTMWWSRRWLCARPQRAWGIEAWALVTKQRQSEFAFRAIGHAANPDRSSHL